MDLKKIELNEGFQKALRLIEEGRGVFVTGKAGTGKSTLLDYFRSATRKKIVVLAPTGVAALNVQGETIHSFFRFKPDVTLQKVKKIGGKRSRIYKEIEAVVIDEVSMLRADLLDCVERFLRLNGRDPGRPFGGAQMIFVGDLYQLPPVVTSKEKGIFETHYKSPYFFDAQALAGAPPEMVELEKIYRQKDEKFIAVLNAIRNNTIDEEGLSLLNHRVGAGLAAGNGSGLSIHLTPLNQSAAEINLEHLHKLGGDVHAYEAEIRGEFAERSYPTEVHLRLAEGAQVMLLNNDARGRWVNGSIGKIESIRRDKEEGVDVVRVRLSGGERADVLPYTWELFHFTYDESRGRIESETVGSFRQYPLRLAWAVTIHKSQGKTFERVVLDMGRGAFAHGQTYVALSRCTSLEGLSLAAPIKKSHVWMDWRIVRFMTGHQYAVSEKRMPLERKLEMIEKAIEGESLLEIVYLKASDEKSRRTIIPREVGPMEYEGRPFTGLAAYCLARRDERVFRVDRILEMKVIERA